MKSSDVLMVATAHMKDFMMNRLDNKMRNSFSRFGQGAMTRDELPLSIVVPSFVLSELRTAFQMGFLICYLLLLLILLSLQHDVHGYDDDAQRISAFKPACTSRWLVSIIQSLVNSFNIA